MVAVSAEIRLPYLLRLTDGRFGELELARAVEERADGQPGVAHSMVVLRFEADAGLTLDQRQQLAVRKADELLRHTNRLLRWYRTITRQPGVLEVGSVHVSPIRFFATDEQGIRARYHDDLAFEPPIRAAASWPGDLENRVRMGLDGNGEPPVAELFLLDAEAARGGGRFREAVLFSWSTIDAVFNATYDRLVEERLSNERRESREFLQGKAGEVPLKVKMTALLSLVANSSLFSDRMRWQQLSESYAVRNRIIHAGSIATESEADTAIGVAHWVVDFMQHVRVG